jgi:alcohol dehydrogenase class IV
MLPAALRVNREVRQGELAELARQVFGLSGEMADAEAVDRFIAEIETICCRVRVPQRLSELGVRAEQIPALVESSRGTSMSANPRDVSDEELTRVLEAML